MQTIGERLEEARKRKGISIREASEATKIRSDYLQKFESSAFEIGLPDIYVRGFLRTYAHYLKLPTEKILTDYASLGYGETRETRRHPEQREIIGRIDLTEAPRPAPAPAPAPLAAEPPAARAAAQSRSVPTAVVTGAPSADRRQKVKLPFIVGGAVLALLVLVLVIRAIFSDAKPPSSASSTRPAATTSAQPAADDRNFIRLVAIGNVHVKVVQASDNRVLFDDDLPANTTRTIQRFGKVAVSYDIGRNLQVEVRGSRFRMSAEGQGRNSIAEPTP